MRRFKSVKMTPEAIEQYELGLADSGDFVWLMTRSDEAGTASHDARGRWSQTGDTILFEVTIRSNVDAPVPTIATVHGERLELAGFGTFG